MNSALSAWDWIQYGLGVLVSRKDSLSSAEFGKSKVSDNGHATAF